jgi:hypothetical protein
MATILPAALLAALRNLVPEGLARLELTNYLLAPTITGGTIDGATIGATTPPQAQIYPPINAQTGTTYTFVLTDIGTLVTLTNASAITATVPPNSSVAFPIGATIPILQLGAGLVTVAAGAGVTVSQVAGSLALLGQYSKAYLTKVAVNTWTLNGDVAA